MTLKEFQERTGALHKDYHDKINKLKIEYAESNNPYKIGDIIEDHYQRIRIEKMGYHTGVFSGDPLFMKYEGPLLKKDGTPHKTGKTGVVYQSNIKKQ